MRTPEETAARRPIIRRVESLVEHVSNNVEGTPYEIGGTDPDACGAALCTIDGNLYCGGDSQAEFAIQSISKALTYALALEEQGWDYVDSRINVEPSGEAFNEISLVGDPPRPANPLVNIGAIAASGCIPDCDFDRILRFYERLAGRDLAVDEDVFTAERDLGARNRALAWLLASVGVLEDPDAAVDAYLRQCSVLVTARDLAVMGATLANRGVQPITGEQVLSPEVAERVLSVMATCGMYDDAGEWMIKVGMPAKSGVGGGIMAAAPGQLGIGTFAPRLDRHGNSVRGTLICERLSDQFDLHFARVPRPHRSTVRRVVDFSDKARLVELQGDLNFLGIEAALQAVLTAAQDRPAVVVDVTRVNHLVTQARDLLPQLSQRLAETGHRLLVIGEQSSLLGRATLCHDTSEAQEILQELPV